MTGVIYNFGTYVLWEKVVIYIKVFYINSYIENSKFVYFCSKFIYKFFVFLNAYQRQNIPYIIYNTDNKFNFNMFSLSLSI